MVRNKHFFIIVFFLFLNKGFVSAQPRYVTLKEASKMHSDSVTAIRLVEGDNAVELLSYDRLNSVLCDGIKSFPYPFPSVAITALHLRDFSTTFLPKCIYQLSELTELIIEDQVLNTIPYEFKALDGLQHLTLITPNLTYIDKEALFLKDLVFLHFDSRKIKLASEHIQMPKLEKLYLYGEVLSFPKFGTFPDLNVLHLHNGTSTAIDPSVFDLPKLEEFHTCDPIIHLNEGISRLNQLTTLSLCSHQNHPTWSNPCASGTYFPQVNLSTTNGTFPRIESLPDAICSLQKLSTLDLHGSGIQSLPQCLWGIDSLRSIYVTDTKLAKLPEPFFASERDLGLIKITISQPNHFDKSSKKALKKIPTIERIKRKKGTFKRTFLVTKVFGKP